MKNICTIMSILLLATFGFTAWVSVGPFKTPVSPEVKILRTNEFETILEVKIYGFETERMEAQGVHYDVIRLPGEMTSQDVGKPEVPRIPKALCVPNEAKIIATVLEAEKVTLKDYLLNPAQEPETDLDIYPPFKIDQITYSSDRLYPSQNVDIPNYGQWRDVYITNTDIYPIQYNPLRKELTVHTRLVLKYTSVGGKGYPEVVEPKFARMYRDVMCNYDMLNINVDQVFTPGVQYLVFTHPNYYNTVRRLVDWHHKRGVKTRFIQKTSFAAQEIKDSIRNEYNSNNPKTLKWVLLVGDVNTMPTYTGWGCPCSDIWYGDLDVNYYADIGIARLSVQDTTNLHNQINKILKYSKNPVTTNQWLTKVVHVAHKEQWPGKYSACVRGIYNYNYRYYRYTMDTMMGAISGNTNAALQTRINQGRNIVNYRGHGLVASWDAWGADSRYWGLAEVNGLNNGDMTPIVNNNACYCGQISSSCLSEYWMNKYPGGAVASLGASNPSFTLANHCYDSTFFIGLGDTYTFSAGGRQWVAPLWDIAWLMNYAGANMVARHGRSTGGANYAMYLFLGDPAMEIWTGPAVPARPTVNHPTIIRNVTQDFIVSVDGKAPINGALVCAMKGTEVYAYGYTTAAGVCTLSVSPTTGGTMDVTVTTHGHLPYEGTCQVTTAVEEEKPQLVTAERLSISTVPFGKKIRISFATPQRRQITIKAFDISGRMVAQNQALISGVGNYDWNPDLSAGIYFVKVKAEHEYTQKIILTR